MKDVIVVEDFTGYPSGRKRDFRAGKEVISVPDDFADLIVGKGHAKLPAVEKSVEEKKEGKK